MKNMYELTGDLLTFISEVATAIRMNSIYNPSSARNPETPRSVMVLSDMLHNLHLIGVALSKGNSTDLIKKIELQVSYWKDSEEEIEKAALTNVEFPLFNLSDGITILEEMKKQAVSI